MEEDMRVAIDLTSLADNLSGIERYAMNIAKALIDLDRGREHTYILLFKKRIYPLFIPYQNQDNVVFKVYEGENKLIFNQLMLPFHLYCIKADRYLFMAFQSPLLFHRKGIYNVIHDLTCWDCPESMRKEAILFFKAEIRNALRCSTGIIVNSQFTKRRILDKFHYKKRGIEVAYCGISDVFLEYIRKRSEEGEDDEVNLEEERIRRKYHLPEQYLLCLSTLEPRKNLPLLVDAYLELCREESVDIPLVLAGRNGWRMDEFLEDIEENYRKSIVITGFVEDEDLPYVYHMADCFIFPSVYEGFGMPPLEAMAVGTMVISSDAASLPEVLGNAVSYFHSGDKDQLKARIRQGIHQECKDVTVREIKARVRRFQWEASARRIGRYLGLVEPKRV